VIAATVDIPERLPVHVSDRIDAVLLHPWLGMPLFFLLMLAVFQGVFQLGAPIQQGLQWLFEWFKEAALVPLLAGAPEIAASCSTASTRASPPSPRSSR
jgi:ferrous iron transport protein B